MKFFDLSHTLEESMPVYPGTEQPVFIEGCTLENDGFREKKITLYSHTGTHMDAPSHLLPEGPCLDEFPLEHFAGSAFVLDVPGDEGTVIGKDIIDEAEDAIRRAEYLLIRSGWSRHWGTPEYFGAFPVLSEDAAKILSALNLKGIGFDCISADPMDSETLPNHRILLEAGMVIVENLTNLDQLPAADFIFSALPLKIDRADGSPVRAAAFL